jgi:ATP adenylyltransferase
MYPYNSGHVMVVPYRHVASLNVLKTEELHDLFETVSLTENIIYKSFKAEGINVGMNLGKAAGAGIESHLHVHLVPRWSGDTNFMTTISGTRVVPDSLENTYFILKEAFKNENN